MKRKWVIPIAAAALALITTFAVVNYLQRVEKRAEAPKPVETAEVVVAKANIAERKIVTPDLIALRQVPVIAIHPSAARRIEDVSNRVAVVSIFADEQVLLSKLAPAGVNVGLSYVIPRDKRAMTLANNEIVGVAGFIFPGDRVDIIATVSLNDVNISKIALQDILVLAVAQKVDQRPGEEPRVTSSVTFALSPEETEALAQLDSSGKLRLALRPYGAVPNVQTAGATLQSVIARSGGGGTRLATVLAQPVASINRTVAGVTQSTRAELASTRQPAAETTRKPPVQTEPSRAAGIPLPPPIPTQPPLLTPPPQVTPEAPKLPADMRLIGLVASTDGSRKIAVIRTGGQTYFVEPGHTLLGFTVATITDNKVILRRGTAEFELFF
ncbi:MAG: Flp pilus assembly protein CpaB [bacterium]